MSTSHVPNARKAWPTPLYDAVVVTMPPFTEKAVPSHNATGPRAKSSEHLLEREFHQVDSAHQIIEVQVESVTGFQPFIVETGGLIHPKSTLFVDHPKVLRKYYRIVMDTLDGHHGKMLCKFKASVLFANFLLNTEILKKTA